MSQNFEKMRGLLDIGDLTVEQFKDIGALFPKLKNNFGLEIIVEDGNVFLVGCTTHLKKEIIGFMDKKLKIIKGADLGSLAVGGKAKLYLPDGKIISTSPVKKYFVAGGNMVIETKNSVYISES